MTTPPFAESPASAQPRRRPLRAALIGVLALVLLGGGGAAAGIYFGWFGSPGLHPSDVMPGSTVAYVQLDLKPSLEQQSQAVNFLREVPGIDRTPGATDPRRLLWELGGIRWVGSTWTDFERDVAPWLGNRIGVGIVNNAADRNLPQIWITAIQVTDEAKAAAKLQEWIDATGNGYEVTTRDGYAIITATHSAGIVHADQAKGMLSANPAFRSDLAAVGDSGAMAGWVDNEALNAPFRDASADQSRAWLGRMSFALRFSGDSLVFTGRMTGWNHPMVNGAGQLGTLPASTGAGISISGGDAATKLGLGYLTGGDSWWGSAAGLDAADIAALLGRNLTVSTPRIDLGQVFAGPSAIGYRVLSDDPARADAALRRSAADHRNEYRMGAHRVDGNVITAATTAGYLEEIAGSGELLGGVPAFTKAVPDHARAALAFYVDLRSLLADRADTSPYGAFVGSLRTVGGQYFDEGSGNGSWSVRVVRA